MALFRDSLALLVGEASIRLTSFLMLAAVSRRFGPAGVGLVALAQTLSQYAWVVSDGGLRLLGTRLLARGQDTRDILEHVFIKRLALLALVMPAIAVAVWRLTDSAEARHFTFLFCCSAFPVAATPDFLAAGKQRFDLLLRYRLLVSAIGLLFIAWFFLRRGSLFLLAVGAPTAYLTGALVLWWLLGRTRMLRPRTSGIVRAASSRAEFAELSWTNVARTGTSLVMNQTLLSVSTIILTAYGTLDELGIYSSAYRVIAVVSSAFFVITQALFPTLAAMPAIHSRKLVTSWWLYATIAGTGLALMMMVGARTIMPVLFGSQFTKAVPAFSTLVFLIPLDIGNALLGTYVLARGRTAASLICISLALLLSLVLNLLLVPAWGAAGAALAMVTTSALLLSAFAATMYCSRAA